jgi:hypothetical protein
MLKERRHRKREALEAGEVPDWGDADSDSDESGEWDIEKVLGEKVPIPRWAREDAERAAAAGAAGEGASTGRAANTNRSGGGTGRETARSGAGGQTARTAGTGGTGRGAQGGGTRQAARGAGAKRGARGGETGSDHVARAALSATTTGTTASALPFKIVSLYQGIGNGSDPASNYNWVVVGFNQQINRSLSGY